MATIRNTYAIYCLLLAGSVGTLHYLHSLHIALHLLTSCPC